MKRKYLLLLIMTILFIGASKVSAVCTKLTSPSGEVSYKDIAIENWIRQSGYKAESVNDVYCSSNLDTTGVVCYYEGEGIKARFQVRKNTKTDVQPQYQTFAESGIWATDSGTEHRLSSVANWNSNYQSSGLKNYYFKFIGSEYYVNHGCPPYAFYYERSFAIKEYYISVIDSENVDEFEKTLEDGESYDPKKLALVKTEQLNEENYSLNSCSYRLKDSTTQKAMAYASIDVHSLRFDSQTKQLIGGDKINTIFSQKLENWEEAVDKDTYSFVAKRFIEKYKVCPNYAIITHSSGHYNLFLSNDQTCDDLEPTFKKKYSTFMECYTLPHEGSKNTIVEDYSEKHEQQIDGSTSCYDYTQYGEDGACETDNSKFSCIWVKGDNTPGYCNTDNLQYVKCGGAFDIPEQAPRIMSFVINLLKIGTPIILILTGIVTLVKAVAASKEDEMKKAQTSLIRKAIAAALVFFVIGIVQFVILKAADSSETGSVTNCMSCFLNNDCEGSVYFKTKVGSTYVCHSVSNPSETVKCGDS